MKHKPVRAYLGCGPVYLEGWDNVDLPLVHHYKASDRPDLVTANQTTPENYYKVEVSKDQFMAGKFHFKEVVCDLFASVDNLPCMPVPSVNSYSAFGVKAVK